MGDPVSLRPARPEDTDFLQSVYASTRADEMALVDWTDEQKAAFCRMQYHAQATHYSTYYPQAETSILLRGETPIGRLIVDRSGDALLLMDIALLPEHRGYGIGTALIRDLMAEARAAGKPVRLHVETFNPAQRLYQRLGFREVGITGVHIEMVYRPDAIAEEDTPHA
jgi:ribosomal protein S18 acetylase RimI-like enzyme